MHSGNMKKKKKKKEDKEKEKENRKLIGYDLSVCLHPIVGGRGAGLHTERRTCLKLN